MEKSTMLLNVYEAASELRLSHWTVRLYIRTGKMKSVRIGTRVLVEPQELRRLIDAGRNEPNAERGAL